MNKCEYKYMIYVAQFYLFVNFLLVVYQKWNMYFAIHSIVHLLQDALDISLIHVFRFGVPIRWYLCPSALVVKRRHSVIKRPYTYR